MGMVWMHLPAGIDQPVVLDNSFDRWRWARADNLAMRCAFGPGAIYKLLERVKDSEIEAWAAIQYASAHGTDNLFIAATLAK